MTLLPFSQFVFEGTIPTFTDVAANPSRSKPGEKSVEEAKSMMISLSNPKLGPPLDPKLHLYDYLEDIINVSVGFLVLPLLEAHSSLPKTFG